MSRTTAAVAWLKEFQGDHPIGLALLLILLFYWRSKRLLLLASRTTAAISGQNDYSWCGCAAAGATRTAGVDSLVRSPNMVSFISAVCHVRQAFNMPQGCSKCRRAGRRQSGSPRDAREPCNC